MGSGYHADFGGLRKRSAQADVSVEHLRSVYDSLSGVLFREGNPLGDDQYGAELEKQRLDLDAAVHSAFGKYLDEISGLGDGLQESRRTYETAEEMSGAETTSPDDPPQTADGSGW